MGDDTFTRTAQKWVLGIAFSNAMVGLVHAMGHALGAVCHIPHGICMSLFLPYVLEYNLSTAEVLGLSYDMASLVNPECVMGIEINPYAAELARLTVWIGEIQWMLAHGLQPSREPILKSLQLIDNRDALLNADGSEATWPQCDVIVGNPPFLGQRFMLKELGTHYLASIRKVYQQDVTMPIWFGLSKVSNITKQKKSKE